jgi:hypothetical protein
MHKSRRQKGVLVKNLTDELDVLVRDASRRHADLDDDTRHEARTDGHENACPHGGNYQFAGEAVRQQIERRNGHRDANEATPFTL